MYTPLPPPKPSYTSYSRESISNVITLTWTVNRRPSDKIINTQKSAFKIGFEIFMWLRYLSNLRGNQLDTWVESGLARLQIWWAAITAALEGCSTVINLLLALLCLPQVHVLGNICTQPLICENITMLCSDNHWNFSDLPGLKACTYYIGWT